MFGSRNGWTDTSICLSPWKKIICPVVIDSLQNQQGKVKNIVNQMEGLGTRMAQQLGFSPSSDLPLTMCPRVTPPSPGLVIV